MGGVRGREAYGSWYQFELGAGTQSGSERGRDGCLLGRVDEGRLRWMLVWLDWARNRKVGLRVRVERCERQGVRKTVDLSLMGWP